MCRSVKFYLSEIVNQFQMSLQRPKVELKNKSGMI
jgi:hypothetical protein